jgi:CRISPR-associated protein Cas5d
MKVERVSYPVMTPSAARGALEAIFWRPEFRWEVVRIEILRPIQYFSVVRNEVASKISMAMVQGWAEHGGRYDATSDRQQRHTLGLRDVAYNIWTRPIVNPGVGEDPAKYRDQFRRRLANGRCFSRPYLGCREFAAFFEAIDEQESPLGITQGLGRMLLDMDYANGSASPVFFDASLAEGVLAVPPRPGVA